MRARWIAIAGAGALALSGCDWRTFDDLADTTWVDSSGGPEDESPAEYGLSLVPVAGTDGATFVVSMRSPVGLAQLPYADDGVAGAVTSTSLGGVDPTASLPERPLLAGDPLTSNVIVAAPIGQFTDPDNTQLAFYDGTTLELLGNIGVGSNRIVGAVALGTTDADTNTDGTDLVASAGSELLVIDSYAANRTVNKCVLDRDAAFGAIIADLDPSGTGAEIALGVGNEAQSGAASKVVIITGSRAAAGADDDPCYSTDPNGPRGDRPRLSIPAPGDEPDFGAALASGDFDGDGNLDLAVGAASANTVYVYTSWDIPGEMPGTPIEITGPTGISGQFGDALAAADLDDDGDHELVVGDRRASPGGITTAGAAHVYVFDGADPGTPYTLHDAEPEENQRFGRALAVGSFGGTDLLAVGADNEVFTYFRTQIPGDADPRVEAQ